MACEWLNSSILCCWREGWHWVRQRTCGQQLSVLGSGRLQVPRHSSTVVRLLPPLSVVCRSVAVSVRVWVPVVSRTDLLHLRCPFATCLSDRSATVLRLFSERCVFGSVQVSVPLRRCLVFLPLRPLLSASLPFRVAMCFVVCVGSWCSASVCLDELVRCAEVWSGQHGVSDTGYSVLPTIHIGRSTRPTASRLPMAIYLV